MLKQINAEFASDYSTRRRVLLKRLDVTAQSFLWGEKGKAKEAEIRAVITRKLATPQARPAVNLPVSIVFSAGKVLLCSRLFLLAHSALFAFRSCLR